ncbi:MAG: DUF1572 family protein [Vicinamibacterales bacterium]
MDVATTYLDEMRGEFAGLRKHAERALAQVDDRGFFHEIDPEANCIGVVVKHVGGNLRSRWTDVLTTDGEKPDRYRDNEFVIAPDDTRHSVMALWARGWGALESSLAALSPADLLRTIYIRAEPHTVLKAIDRAALHTAMHVGQIVLLAKHVQGASWTTLSIARGQSAAFNERLRDTFTKT